MKKIFMPALAVATLLVSSCSDWTGTENLDFSRPTPGEQNPGKYQSYLAALKDYKNSEHRVMLITMPGTSVAPTRQNQHLMAVPDSIDYICMTNVAGLHPTLVGEISEVYAAKGTRTLCVVDYATIENAWKQMQEAETEALAAKDEASEIAEFAAYCKEQTELQLSYCDQYGFAGIEISYLGRTSTEVEAQGQEVFMTCVKEWRDAHSDKLMFFRGYVHNLVAKWRPAQPEDPEAPKEYSLLADCKYIVILCGTSSSSSQLTMEIRRKMGEGVPNKRFIMEVAIPSLEDPTQVGATAQVAAAWVIEPEERFTKVGLAVSNAQDDYFRIDMIYKNIRQAMPIMNPTATEGPEEPEAPKTATF